MGICYVLSIGGDGTGGEGCHYTHTRRFRESVIVSFLSLGGGGKGGGGGAGGGGGGGGRGIFCS